MKNMRQFIWTICCVWLLSACTQQEIIDTGISSPYHNCSIMEYLRSDDYNWELTVQMIEHAGLTDLFEGEVDSLPEITFWGITSYSIQRFIFDSQENEDPTSVYMKVTDIPREVCREFLLKHVSKGKILKADIAYRNKEYEINAPEQDGGTWITCLAGNRFIAYLEGSDYAGVPDAGEVNLRCWSPTWGKIPMASPDIQPLNGVVHALNYSYRLGHI